MDFEWPEYDEVKVVLMTIVTQITLMLLLPARILSATILSIGRGYPVNTNWVSVATMRITPIVIVVMTAISLISGFSKRNRNANINTNASVDDLHSAGCQLNKEGEGTVERESDEFKRRI